MSKTAEIKCLHSDVWPIEKLVEHPRNPNRHPEPQLNLLAQIIVTRGWRSAIVVSENSGYIVKGHGRYAAAKKAGLTEVPVEIQAYASEAEEWADIVADNRIAELSEMDTHSLRELLLEIEATGFDMLMTGFTEVELQNLELQGERDDDDTEAIAAPPGESTTGSVRTHLKFGKHMFPLTEEEFAELEKRGNAYKEASGTRYGFVRNLLGMA
jgi:ParB-like chromosome segregation protein Spo0J